MKLEINLNINDQFEVHLTEPGYEVLHNSLERDFKNLAVSKGRVDILKAQFLLSHESPNTETRRKFVFTLWEIMNIFGPQIYNGNPKQMFVNNSLVKVVEA